MLKFVKDLQVSCRILAVISETKYTKRFTTKCRFDTKTNSFVNKRDFTSKFPTQKQAESKWNKLKPKKVEREEVKVRVICGTNGKQSTRYFIIPGDNVKNTKNKKVAKTFAEITNEEFVENYPKQCEKFKRMFKKEYLSILGSM